MTSDVLVNEVSSIKDINELRRETELAVVAYVNPCLENNPEKE